MLYIGGREVKQVWCGGRPAVQAWAGGTPVWGGEEEPRDISSWTIDVGRTFGNEVNPSYVEISDYLGNRLSAGVDYQIGSVHEGNVNVVTIEAVPPWSGTTVVSSEIVQ